MKISKDKFNLLAYGLIIVNALILLSLPVFLLNTFPDISPDYLQKINDLYKFKKEEQKVWDSVKGVQTDINQEDTISSELSSTELTLLSTPSASPTPSEILTPTPIVKVQNPTILLLGDSMMLEGFGPELERALSKYPNANVIRKGKYSSGLNKISYYDWFAATESYMKEFKPDIAIVVFGGNDCQEISDEGKAYPYNPNSKEWTNAYAKRVDRYISILEKYTKYSYWIGHPMSGNSNFKPKLEFLNSIYKAEVAKSSKVFYVDPSPRFSPNGVYSAYVADDNGLRQIAKYTDGVHLTPHGGKVLSSMIIKQMADRVELN